MNELACLSCEIEIYKGIILFLMVVMMVDYKF